MPSLFRRNNTTDAAEPVTPAEPAEPAAPPRPKGHTPSKKDLGVTTPKRSDGPRRRADPLPTDPRERRKAQRERDRANRAEAMAGMRAGDERYLMARDRGPERALVRDIVDSRRTAGTWFFVGAMIIILASSAAIPEPVRLTANLLWVVLVVAVVLDSILISRKIKKLISERHPGTNQRMGSLYFYGIARSISFRRMRMPNPRVNLGQKI